MKKPGRKILYGAGMLAMSLSLTACDRLFELNGAVYGPPPLTTPGSQDRPEDNPDVYGPPPSTTQEKPEENPNVYGPPPSTTQVRPEDNPNVYGPPRGREEEQANPDEGDTTEDTPDADGNDTEAE